MNKVIAGMNIYISGTFPTSVAWQPLLKIKIKIKQLETRTRGPPALKTKKEFTSQPVYVHHCTYDRLRGNNFICVQSG